MSKQSLACAVTILVGALGAPSAFAWTDRMPGENVYIGGSIGDFRYKSGNEDRLSPKVFSFRVGVPLNPYLAIEGRVGKGLSTDFTALLGGYDLQIDSLYGGYLKGNIPLSPRASLYGLAGYSAIQLRRDFRGAPDQKVTDDGASFAGGLDVYLNRNLLLNAEWGRFLRINRTVDGYDADILSIGLLWLF